MQALLLLTLAITRHEPIGFANKHDPAEIAMIMQQIHDCTLPRYMELFDGTTIEFQTDPKLGEVLSYYWENDKSTFSILYHQLLYEGLFKKLNDVASGYKRKIYKNNLNVPPMNLFF